MKKRGFTLVEIIIALALLGILLTIVNNVFLTGTNAYRKEIDALTIVDRGRNAMIRMRRDIRNANHLIMPGPTGEPKDKLVMVKHMIDFNRPPENTPDYEESPVYFENLKISYYLEEPEYGPDENWKKEKYKDLKLLVRHLEGVDEDGNQLDEKEILNRDAKSITFKRETLKFSNISPETLKLPVEGGISADNVIINLVLKSYREEDAKIMNVADFDELSGFEVELSTYVYSKGAFLGGDWE
ncbi:MAG: PilW family protein [Candidatus Muiribacteriota bacterium]